MRSVVADHWRDFGQALKGWRAARGYTLRGFARAVAMTHSYQSMLEAGKVPPPSPAVLRRMAEVLDLPAHTLFLKAGKLPPETWHALWTHPALPPILSTLPEMTLTEAEAFCRLQAASLPDDPA